MTDFKPCSTCRFLGDASPISYFDEEGYEVESEHRTCQRIIHGNGADAGRGALSEPAVVTDGSGYAARLRVLPTFGCSLHEPKETA